MHPSPPKTIGLSGAVEFPGLYGWRGDEGVLQRFGLRLDPNAHTPSRMLSPSPLSGMFEPMRTTILFALVALTAAPALAQDEKKYGDGAYFGTYDYVSGQRGDQKLPAAELDGTIQVTEGKLSLLDAEGVAQYVMTYTVDHDDSPIKITMAITDSPDGAADGATAKGLVGVKGELVTLIYDFASGDYPDDFEPDNDSQFLFVLKKQSGADFSGTYLYVKGMKGDTEVPEDNLAGDIKLTNDKFILLSPGGEEVFVMAYEVDEVGAVTKVSMEITSSIMQETVGGTAKGLMKLEGSTLSVIYDYAGEGYPDDFTPDSPTQNLFVLKKK